MKVVISSAAIEKFFHSMTALPVVVTSKLFALLENVACPETTLGPCGLPSSVVVVNNNASNDIAGQCENFSFMTLAKKRRFNSPDHKEKIVIREAFFGARLVVSSR